MRKNKGKPELLVLAIPFLGLILWTFSVAFTHTQGKEGQVRIVGYDPVDLLSGHYLRFRYDFGPVTLCKDPSSSRTERVCACLIQDAARNFQANIAMPCADAARICPQYVQGSCQSGTFLTGSERFYFPENYASVLSVVPEQSFAQIRIQEDGTIALQDIVVGKLPLIEYAKMKLEEPKP